MTQTSAQVPAIGAAAQARRLYLHKLNGAPLTPEDVGRMVESIESLEAQLAAVEAAFAPVQDWYQSDEEHLRPLAERVADAVEDLQSDRAELLALRRKDQPVLEVNALTEADIAAIDRIIADPEAPTPHMLAALRRHREMIAAGTLVSAPEQPEDADALMAHFDREVEPILDAAPDRNAAAGALGRIRAKLATSLKRMTTAEDDLRDTYALLEITRDDFSQARGLARERLEFIQALNDLAMKYAHAYGLRTAGQDQEAEATFREAVQAAAAILDAITSRPQAEG